MKISSRRFGNGKAFNSLSGVAPLNKFIYFAILPFPPPSLPAFAIIVIRFKTS